jgi:hypothetical protein
MAPTARSSLWQCRFDQAGRTGGIEPAGAPWGERLAASPPKPLSPSSLLRSRPFGPVGGRCRDFANPAGPFAWRQFAAATDACAPTLAGCSRLDALSCILGVRFGFFESRLVGHHRESLSSSPSVAKRPKASSDIGQSSGRAICKQLRGQMIDDGAGQPAYSRKWQDRLAGDS